MNCENRSEQENTDPYLDRIREDFINMVTQLKLSAVILTKGLMLIEEFGELHIPTNMHPKSIAGILVYFLCHLHQIPISKRNICTQFDIGKQTLKGVSAKFRKDPRFSLFMKKLNQ